MPGRNLPDYPSYVRAIIESGITVIHKCTSVRYVLKTEAIGCDAVSVDGFECGGIQAKMTCPTLEKERSLEPDITSLISQMKSVGCIHEPWKTLVASLIHDISMVKDPIGRIFL